jgi:hypothetical protein
VDVLAAGWKQWFAWPIIVRKRGAAWPGGQFVRRQRNWISTRAAIVPKFLSYTADFSFGGRLCEFTTPEGGSSSGRLVRSGGLAGVFVRNLHLESADLPLPVLDLTKDAEVWSQFIPGLKLPRGTLHLKLNQLRKVKGCPSEFRASGERKWVDA